MNYKKINYNFKTPKEFYNVFNQLNETDKLKVRNDFIIADDFRKELLIQTALKNTFKYFDVLQTVETIVIKENLKSVNDEIETSPERIVNIISLTDTLATLEITERINFTFQIINNKNKL